MKTKTFVSTNLSDCYGYLSDFVKNNKAVLFDSMSAPRFENDRFKVDLRYDLITKSYQLF